MDNKYEGQEQFGQNQQVQNAYVANQQMPNQQVQNAYVPNQQMPNQYGQNPYGQGVNPNLYNTGNQPYGQGMYGYNPYQKPVDPVLHAEQVNKANKKKKIFMGFVIGAISLAVIGFIVGIVALVMFIFKSYDIEEYDQVAEACEEVLNLELEREDSESFIEMMDNKGYDIVDYASGYTSKNGVSAEIIWAEMATDGDASSCYSSTVDELEEQHEEIKDKYSYNSYSSGINKSEYNYEEDDERMTMIVLKSGRCVMLIQIYGDEDKVEDKVDELLDELD